ncbi:RluA family pseudouridine synthase [Dehalobacter sp. DCM]|uniref:RluA family pseudouridine synthase n=1 Tax=Dehalobacter sp. DCM TaxID=2907827 RepID=UPI0030819997|nr:RluA family pseudouridine synthase [Dehalobacter sp. DCM]
MTKHNEQDSLDNGQVHADNITDVTENDGPDTWQTVEVTSGQRLDTALAAKTEVSRSYIQVLIQDERVLVNGLPRKANYRLQDNDTVEISFPPLQQLDVQPENIPLTIVYEDEDLLVINKPQGMVVHPAPGAWSGTLVNALLYHCQNLSGINGIIRPGIVHRIDKDTSGLLVVAKNDDAHHHLAGQIKEHTAGRTYRAVVHGVLSEPSGTINAPIGRDPKDRKKMGVVFKHSREAVTHYEVLERFVQFTEIRAVLETGRTHQIRVHMAYMKHPVLGDPLYGPKKNPFGLAAQVLHAETLQFVHPRTGEKMKFTVSPPASFITVLETLRNSY